MRIRPYWRVLPRARFYVAKSPRAGCIATSALIVLLMLLSFRSLFSQVTAVAELRRGVAEVLVGNPTALPLLVTVTLFRDATDSGGPVTLGDSVDALITPGSFTIQPGEFQMVRVRVRELLRPDELLRVVTVMDPRVARDSTQAAQVTVVMKLITKAKVVEP